MISTGDFCRGKRILIEGKPYEITDITTQSPSARGAATLVKIKARNLLDGKLINETIRSGLKFDEPNLQFTQMQFLYVDGADVVLMDISSYEQFNLPLEVLGSAAKFLQEGMELKAIYFDDNLVNAEMPKQVEVEVASVEPAAKGNTASGGVTTTARLTNDIEIQVPTFIKEGQKIVVDTEKTVFVRKV